jgi:hypothetical protein
MCVISRCYFVARAGGRMSGLCEEGGKKETTGSNNGQFWDQFVPHREHLLQIDKPIMLCSNITVAYL